MNEKKIPVILDTDIGGDIDDIWALAFLLRCPELDLKLVTLVLRDSVYSSKITAKLCSIAGQPNIPIGYCKEGDSGDTQQPWIEDYNLSSYPGKIYKDGIAEMIRIIMESEEQVTVIAIGPATNLTEAIRREPRIGEKARLVSMMGSVYKGYTPHKPSREHNVHVDVEAVKQSFAGWKNIVLSPLDVCFDDLVISGERWERMQNARCKNPLMDAVLINYDIWRRHHKNKWCHDRSTELCDTLAVYLAFSTEGLEIDRMKLEVTDDGMTVPSDTGVEMDVAIRWKNLDGFLDLMTQRLCGD